MFPLHEQRILNQLMTSWVQAVCERQPLGENSYIFTNMHKRRLTFSCSEMANAFQCLCKEIPPGQGSSFGKQTHMYLPTFFSAD